MEDTHIAGNPIKVNDRHNSGRADAVVCFGLNQAARRQSGVKRQCLNCVYPCVFYVLLIVASPYLLMELGDLTASN